MHLILEEQEMNLLLSDHKLYVSAKDAKAALRNTPAQGVYHIVKVVGCPISVEHITGVRVRELRTENKPKAKRPAREKKEE